MTVKGLDGKSQPVRHLKKLPTMIEKEKIKGMARLQKEVDGIPQIHLPRRKLKKKLEVSTMKVTTQPISTVTVCIRSRSIKTLLIMTFYQKNRKNKQNKKDYSSDEALDNFLQTFREEVLKEMNYRHNKWIMFSKCLERNKNEENDEEALKKGEKGWALWQKLIPQYQVLCRKEGS